MKFARFRHHDRIAYGVVQGEELAVLADDPVSVGAEPTGERIPLTEATLLAPVTAPSKIVCVGRNYRDHAAELGNEVPVAPLLFFKPSTAIIGPDDSILRPVQSQQVDFEGELVAVIGRTAKNVSAERALDYVFGYTIGNDVTARDLQKPDKQWARAKGFDTFCPLGPVIETEFDLTGAAEVTTRVNGEVRQQGPVTDMIFSLPDVIAYASAAFTLLPGDLIMTGTPAGVGQIVAGDQVEVEITGLGVLRNPVRDV